MNVFDIKKLESVKSSPPTYVIGTDTYDENAFTFCLSKIENGKLEILLLKSFNKEEKFKEEVENLSKYFNATIYKDKK